MTKLDGEMRKLARRACGFRASPVVAIARDAQTILGGVRVGAPGETWPTTAGGVPLVGIFQINLSEAPLVPSELEGVALIAFFCEQGSVPSLYEEIRHWVMRAYASTDGLVPYANGEAGGVAVEWFEIAEDFPHLEELPPDLCETIMSMNAEDEGRWRAQFPNVGGHKLGGWGAFVQWPPRWSEAEGAADAEARFCLQVASDPDARIAWGDGGILAIARGSGEHAGLWLADAQCY